MPQRLADIRQRQANKPVSRSPVSTRTVPGAPQKNRSTVILDRERQRPLVLGDHADARGSVPLSTGTVTVPTVPACTSQRRKVSGAIQRRMFAISSGVASSYFIDDFTRMKPDDATILGVPGRATISGPSADSATGISPGAGVKISADVELHVLGAQSRRPAVYPVASDPASPRFASPCTGIGEPAAGGSIQMESDVRTHRRRESVQHHDVGLHLRIVFRGRFKHRLHLRIRGDQRLQQRAARPNTPPRAEAFSAGSSITARSSCGNASRGVETRFQIPSHVGPISERRLLLRRPASA